MRYGVADSLRCAGRGVARRHLTADGRGDFWLGDNTCGLSNRCTSFGANSIHSTPRPPSAWRTTWARMPARTCATAGRYTLICVYNGTFRAQCSSAPLALTLCNVALIDRPCAV